MKNILVFINHKLIYLLMENSELEIEISATKIAIETIKKSDDKAGLIYAEEDLRYLLEQKNCQ